MNKLSVHGSLVFRCFRGAFIALMVAISIYFVSSSSVPVALAQGPNLVGNPGFETGSLLPWRKWGYPRSTVITLNCCGHSGSSWSAWVVPDGRYVELQQDISVVPRRTYILTAWSYTNGMNAQIAWWSNAPNINSTVCNSTTSTSYALRYCELNVPDNTGAFNVHLGANSPQGSGQWAITDDWSLTLIGEAVGNRQAFSVFPAANANGVNVNIWTAQQPSAPLGSQENIASPVGICTGFPCDSMSLGFVETGFSKGTFPGECVAWPVGCNQLQQYVAWKSINGQITNEFHKGDLSDNTWYNMGVEYDNFLNSWVATRDGQQVFVFSNSENIDFTTGAMVTCGPEATPNEPPPLNVQCGAMQYRAVGQGWTSYNYNNVQIAGKNCVYKPTEFGSIGWGPCF